MAIMPGNRTGLSIEKFHEAPFAGKHPKLIKKGTKAAAAEEAVIAAEAIAVAELEEVKRLAAEFEAMGGGALTMAIAQEAEPGDPLRKCCLAHGRLRVSEARSINSAEILMARTDAVEGGSGELVWKSHSRLWTKQRRIEPTYAWAPWPTRAYNVVCPNGENATIQFTGEKDRVTFSKNRPLAKMGFCPRGRRQLVYCL
jgi:hypothetical protein